MTKAPGPIAILRSLLWDVGLSLGAFFVAHWLGASDYVALLAGSVVALLRVLWVAARTRTFDVFAGIMVGVFGIGLLLSFLTGDARFMLAKESLATAAAGIAFGVSCFVGRPLIYHAALRMKEGKPEEVAEFDAKWQTVPQFRRTFRIMTAVWGAGLLVDAVGRLPLIYTLSVPAAMVASHVLLVAVFVILAVWNAWFARRAQARAAAAEPAAQLA